MEQLQFYHPQYVFFKQFLLYLTCKKNFVCFLIQVDYIFFTKASKTEKNMRIKFIDIFYSHYDYVFFEILLNTTFPIFITYFIEDKL